RRIHKESERVKATTYCGRWAALRKWLLILVLLGPLGATARDVGPLLRIIDGDTYEMLLEGAPTRVRLANADTPETGRRAKCVEERMLGQRATDWVREQVEHRAVAVFPLGRADKYGRHLVHVRIDGEDLGRLLVKEGLARPYGGERRRSWC
ncbi:MAG TPA: thermonuclease family protein, partial [Reyranellaceae bacterium]|nr:thermonuclease family protein [Reyranellaceae bacterium]